MFDGLIHPGVILIIGGLSLLGLRGLARQALSILIPATALLVAWNLPLDASWGINFLDYQLNPIKIDRLSKIFSIIFTLMAAVGSIYSLRQSSKLELPAALTYAGSAVGVALAGDWITVFIFWECMAIGSTLVIWSAKTPESERAASRYIMMHLLGGVVLFAGIAGHILQAGHAAIGPVALDSVVHWLMLAGVLINAGAPPFSSWLPDAYPEASWSGTVFLSAFTTKTSVYVLIRAFAGHDILIWVGLFMVFYGIVYALLENDMRRILAYSIINQVGFMITGIGIGTEMAINGAAAHAFTHIIYKALLLMSAGSVLMMTNRRKCSELGGLFHTMPWTTLFGTIGALAISSFPLTSGFVSKSMVSQASADTHMLVVWLFLTAASAGVFLHAGIKFPWFVFFQKDSGLRPKEPPKSMMLAMGLLAFLCIYLGIAPQHLYALLPHPVNYEPYTAGHVISQTQLLLFSGLAFFVMLKFLKRTLTITLDTDWVWRCLLARMFGWTLGQWNRLLNALSHVWEGNSRGLFALLERLGSGNGPLTRTASVRSMSWWLIGLLGLQLLLFYF